MTNNINFSSPDSFFQAQNAPKSVFGRGSAPDPTGGANYDAPSDPLVGWGGGYPLPINPPHSTPSASRTRRLRRLGSQAPLNTKSWLRLWPLVPLAGLQVYHFRPRRHYCPFLTPKQHNTITHRPTESIKPVTTVTTHVLAH